MLKFWIFYFYSANDYSWYMRSGNAFLTPPNFNVNIVEIDIKILPFTEVEINLFT
jgi:hypothetical protein